MRASLNRFPSPSTESKLSLEHLNDSILWFVRRPHSYLPPTLDATKILGLQIATARRRRRMTVDELCERAAISAVTLRNVERGAPTVAIGIFFDVATLLGIHLYDTEPNGLPAVVAREHDRLFLLPSRVRQPSGADDDDDF